MTLEDVKKLVGPVHRRVMLMVAKGIIKMAGDSDAQVEVYDGEIRDKLDRIQEFGFASRPKPGAEAVMVFVGGNRDHGVVIGTSDKRYRPSLEEGEAAMYTADVVIKIKADKTIEISGASKVTIPCDLEVSGKVTATGEVTGNGKKLSIHTHAAGTLAAPNGPVTGSTGAPT